MSNVATQPMACERVTVGLHPKVRALFTLRGELAAEASRDPRHAGMNLGLHVGDDAHAVMRNRQILASQAAAHPVFMKQVHGNQVVRLHAPDQAPGRRSGDYPDVVQADGAFTTETGVGCVVMVADCLPVLMADEQGRFVAAAHAGWRGLAAGVIEATLKAACAAVSVRADKVHAWLGPCIGPMAFEVGRDVVEAFAAKTSAADQAAVAKAFRPSPNAARHADGAPRWLGDLPRLAELRLRGLGVHRIVVHGGCTFSDPARYFSYRRDGVTGRHAAMIWLAEPSQVA